MPPDLDACLDGIAARAADPVFAAEVLARVVPVTRTFALGAEIEAQLVDEIGALVDARSSTGAFHVRSSAAAINSSCNPITSERVLGTALVDGLGRAARRRA